MKIRSNFVSNSSSSSFIIQFNDIEKEIVVAGQTFSIKDFFDSIEMEECRDRSCETEMHEITYNEDDKESLISTLDNYITWSNEDDKESLIKLKNDVKKSNDIFARFDISYHNKALNFIFNLLKEYKAFIIRYNG